MVRHRTVEGNSVREGRSVAHYFLSGVMVRCKQGAILPFRLGVGAARGSVRAAKSMSKIPHVLKEPGNLVALGVMSVVVGGFGDLIVNAGAGERDNAGQVIHWSFTNTPSIVMESLVAAPVAGLGLYWLGRGTRALCRNFVETGKAEERRRLVAG